MRFNTFEEIDSWKRARGLLALVYRVTQEQGFRDDVVLRRQLRSAALSIMANIAEGYEGRGSREFVRYLRIALRSAAEVQSHLYAARDQSYLTLSEFDSIYRETREVKALIGGLIRYLVQR